MSPVKRLSTLFILLWMFTHQAYASVQADASVSNTQIFLGDVFVLTIEVNDTGSEYQLDTSALNDDFTVYRPSRSQQSMYINGDFTATTTWSVRLQAKQTGDFTIPSFNIGDTTTSAIDIKVSQPGKQQQSTMGQAIFIENIVDKNKVYLDQPILLTSKIYISENINDGDIQPPQLAGADIERIDSEDQSQLVRNGIRYRVFTYQYQISPSLTGEDTISSPILVGSVRKSVRINSWKNKIIAEPINIRGNNIEINVKAIPEDFQGTWLVSEDVRLLENNDLQAKQYKVGEPITRSISLQIASLPLEKMPEIKLNYNNMRYYPDQDQLTQGTGGNLLYSQRTISHAIIANKSGTLVLPKITVPWWNSVTEKQEYATLPAQILTILPADKPTTQQSQATQSLPTTQHPQSNLNNRDSLGESAVSHTDNSLIWQIISGVLFLLLIALAIYHYYYTQRSEDTKNSVEKQPIKSNAYQALLAALNQAQPQPVYNALLRYLQTQKSDATALKDLLHLSGLSVEEKLQLETCLQQLELACSGQTHQWDAKLLLSLLKVHHKKSVLTQNKTKLSINP